jgi:branched-chain amino acid transport system substrate-binding protein
MDPVKTKLATLTVSAIALALGATCAQAQQQGVSKNEIVLGTIQDLSGPIAAFGKQIRNGMQLRVDELNEQNGVGGRKIKLIVEDSAYDPKKAVLAAQKLVNSDKVFVVAGHLGTAQNNAAIPVQLEKNIINFFPVTASREMFDPFHRLKFAFAATYFDQMKSGLPQMFANKKYAKPCIIYQDDDFGLEVLRGAEEGLKNIGVPLAEKTSYKRGSTDFSSQVAKMKSTGCDLVILGTIIRETIGTIGESRKTGFAPDFFGSSAAYTDIIHKLGGPAMNGLYAMHTVGHPYPDDASPAVSFWAKKYKTKFNEDGTVFSAYGYVIVDQLATAMAAAGNNLTTDSLVKAIETTKFSADIFGGKAPTFSPTKRLGSSETRMSQIKNGKWTVVSEYLAVPK